MPMNYQEFRARADETALSLTRSSENWRAFLTTAARLYKYPYHEQLMIYSQRPDATACAEYDIWNNRMGRYVRRGSKGIMLAGDKGTRYVFDVSDTGTREKSRPFKLWEYTNEHEDIVKMMLTGKYGAEGDDLFTMLNDATYKSAQAAWVDNRKNILDNVANSFLEEYDEYNIQVKFVDAVTVSTTFAVLSRCGIDPGEYLVHEDFLSIFDFNTVTIISELGAAVSGINEDMLRSIEVTIRNYEREKNAERTQDHERVRVHEEWGLSNPEHDLSRAESDIREIRNDESGLSEEPQQGIVESADTSRRADATSVLLLRKSRAARVRPSWRYALNGDRQDSAREDRRDDAAADENGRSDGGAEINEPAAMGWFDEQLQSAGGGNHTGRVDLQLNLFASEQEQITAIDNAEGEVSPFAFSLSDADFENLLRAGSNTRNSRMMIATEFSKNKGLESNIEFLKETYHGGYGIKGEVDNFSAWYAEDGIHVSRGTTARYSQNAHIYTWNDVAEKIAEMLDNGTFASNVELEEALGFEREQIAEELWYLRRDLSAEAQEQGYLSNLNRDKFMGFPDETADIAEKLKSIDFKAAVASDLSALIVNYENDKSLIRFNYHNPQKMLEKIVELSIDRTTYTSELAEVPAVSSFITDDEINNCLCGGSSIEGGKGRIYAYFLENHTMKERVDFLKNEYGIGGHTHALSNSDDSNENHDGKGIKFTKGDCTPIEMSWNSVSKRISELVRADRYFTPEAKEKYDANKRVKQFDNLHEAYFAVKNEHPTDIVLFQLGDFFEMLGDDAKAAAEILDIHTTTRRIEGVGKTDICGIPAFSLENNLEKLRAMFNVTVSAIDAQTNERTTYSMPKRMSEAERAMSEKTEITQHNSFHANGAKATITV